MHKLILFVSALMFAITASGQDAGSAKPYELSFQGGVFLPSHVYRTREILKGLDFRTSFPTGKGKFEIDAFFANAEGVTYRALSVDYRVDVGLDEFPAFVLVGLNGDFWTPPAPYDSQLYAGGWHFGGGFFQPLFGGWSAREDFRYRLGPGTCLLIGLGFSYQFSN